MEIISLAAVVFISVILSLLVYINNSKSDTNKLFSLLNITIAIWAVVNYMSLHASTGESTLLWMRLTTFFAVPQATLFLLLSLTLPKEKLQLAGKKLFVLLVLSFLTMVATISPYVFTGVNFKNSGFEPVVGYGILLFASFIVISVSLTIFVFIRRYLRAIGPERRQLGYVLLGIGLMAGLMITTIVIPVFFFQKVTFVIFAPIYALVFLLLTSCTIIRHRLMDIRLVVARSISYLLLVFILAVIYVGGMLVFGNLIFKNSNSLITSTLLALVISLTFQPLLKFIERITDRVFYKGKYDANQLLSDLAHIMSTNIELQPLASQTLQVLSKEVKITKEALILQGEGDQLEIIEEGFDKSLTINTCQFISLLDQHGIVIFDELEEGDVKQAMRVIGVSIAKVLHVKDKVVGYLILGEKASGEIYSEQDLRVLDILAPELAVAIQNAQSYDKIKRFNVILSQEVEKATYDLKVANQRLKELDHLKDDFVSIASHELRTPMTAIKSYAWMALNRPDITLSEKMKKYLSRTLISTDRLINLVNDMLNVSRIESGRIEIRPQSFNVQALAEEVATEVAAKAGEKMIHVTVSQQALPQVFADPDKVHQVLLNLVGNSLKFTPADGSITVDFFTDGQMVDVLVKDSGVGITKEDLSRLFQKFGRLDNSYVAAATAGGTGLGLFISKSLVELMHGKIWVSSEGLNKGTTFGFSIPIASKAILDQAEKYTRKVIGGEAKVLEPVVI